MISSRELATTAFLFVLETSHTLKNGIVIEEGK